MKLTGCAVLAMGLFLSANLLAQDGSRAVFDGAGKSGGQAWTDPKDTVSFSVSSEELFRNGKHLDLNAKWSSWWAGGGWNWAGWYDPDGTLSVDASGYSNLVFQIKLKSGAINDLWVSLTDSSNKNSAQVFLKKDCGLPAIGAQYAEVKIPMQKFLKDGFNPKAIWGINFGIVPETESGEARLFIAQIEFAK